MPLISAGVEYGLHSLLYLADERSGVKGASVSDLAKLQSLSIGYLAKLFTRLRKAGLVLATEGIQGGFTLARPPQNITVAQVVDAIDGPIILLKCRHMPSPGLIVDSDRSERARQAAHTLRTVMQDAEQSIRDELHRHTLAELAQHRYRKEPALHQQQVMQWLDGRAAGRQRSSSE